MANVKAEFHAACSRFDGKNFDDLDTTDRILVAIWGIEAEVNNGGFDQYYFNGAGDQAFFAPTALREIGARRMAEIASRANALFGPEGPSKDRFARQNQLAAITQDGELDPWDSLDREFQDYPDDVAALLAEFLDGETRRTM